MAAALLAVLLIGAADGMLVSEACQDHCSGTYPEHTYPNVSGASSLALHTVTSTSSSSGREPESVPARMPVRQARRVDILAC